MKSYFPNASCMLMLFLLDEFAVSQIVFSKFIMVEIKQFLEGFYQEETQENQYKNLRYLEP